MLARRSLARAPRAHRRGHRPGIVLMLGALTLAVVSVATPAVARAQHDNLAGLPHKQWCKAYDKLPMDDMTKQMMIDEMTFYPAKKHDLSRPNCQRVVPDLVASLQYAMRFPTAADAVRGGFHMIAVYLKGQGAHYIGPEGFGTTFNRKRPNFLLYGGNSPSAPLVGMMWLINSGQQPPIYGLAGNNDHWHRHGLVCMVRGVIVAEGLTNETCAALGGSNIDISSLWMLHAWIVPGYTYPPDIFRPHVPFLTDTPPDGS